MSERVIDCPICKNPDRCFEEIQETFSSFICFNCGFMSHSDYIEGWEGLDAVTRDGAILVDKLKVLEETTIEDEKVKLWWFPSVLNMGSRGIIFPEGSVDNWKWTFAKVVDVPVHEMAKYPIPGKENEFYKTRLDVENATRYDKYDFLTAVKEMGIAKDIK